MTNGLPSRSPPIHDPHADQRRILEAGLGVGGAQCGPRLVVDARHDVEEGRVVVAQPGVDLVDDGWAVDADERGLPHGEDLAPDRCERCCLFCRVSSVRPRKRMSSVMRFWASKIVRRRVSVGCAVITGTTVASASMSPTCSSVRSVAASLA